MKIVIEAEFETFEGVEEVLKSAVRTIKQRVEHPLSGQTISVKYGNRLPTGNITLKITD